MKRIVEESSQNVNSNAGIFLAKQILDTITSFSKFDSCQQSAKSLACQTYSNSSIAKTEVALMTLGKTSFCTWEVKHMLRDEDLFPRYSTATWWTNLAEDADTVIRLYHDHATSEQFHSELKTGMDVEGLPSGDYRTNSLILSLSTLAFNVLRRIGQTARQV